MPTTSLVLRLRFAIYAFVVWPCACQEDGLSVSPSSCEWTGGRFGQTNRCAANQIPVGSCGSTANADCDQDDSWHELLCCPLEDFRRSDCTTNKGFPGKRVSCPEVRRSDEYLVNGACGSAVLFDCGFFTHSVHCCRGLLGSSWVGSSGVCYWKYGGSGERIRCENDNEAVFGRCGSGANADCSGEVHGIQCCKMRLFPARQNRREIPLD